MRGIATIALALAVAALVSPSLARAGIINHEFNFDGVPAGTQANLLPQPASLGVSFENAAYLPDLDSFGDPIPGTERWRPDDLAPPVLVDDPNNYGRGNAPSPANALEALFQPVLILFPQPFTLDATGFSLVLDNDMFGDNGTLPGFEDISIQFLDSAGGLLLQIPVNQTVPGFAVSTGSVGAVSSVLLPAGAFYDNIRINGVPEPTTLGMLVIAGMFVTRRRR